MTVAATPAPAARGGLCAVVFSPQQPRQLRYIGGDAPGLVAGELGPASDCLRTAEKCYPTRHNNVFGTGETNEAARVHSAHGRETADSHG